MRFNMKKILSLLLSAVIILSGFCFAFADDPEDSSSGSSAEVFSFSDSDLEFISQASDDDDLQLRQAAAIMAATSTYDIDDIYSILSSVRMIDNSRYVWATYDESVWSEVHNVYNKLITNSYNNTYYSVSELVAQLLSQFTSFSSFFYSPISGSASLWQLTDDIKTFVGLGLFDSQANPYLDLINSKIGTLTSSMTSGFNAVLTRQGQLLSSVDSLRSDVQGTTSAVNNTTNAVNNTTNAVNNTTNAVNNTTNAVNNVVSSVDSLKSDFNFVSWTFVADSYLGCKLELSDSEYLTSGNVTSDHFYSYFSYPNNINQLSSSVYKFIIPIRRNTTYQQFVISSIELYAGTGSSPSAVFYNDFYYEYSNPNGLIVYFTNFELPRSTSALVLKFNLSSSQRFTIANLSNYGIYYITDSNIDYYYVSNWILQSNLASLAKKYNDIYMTDDIVNAKQNQQAYEDQVISDFTGSGSASAKLSDAASAKDISSSVSSGLVSGASVNNTLSVFGSNSGFWGWFSQENSDYINSLSSQSQLRSSGSGSDWVIDDPYQRNADELQSILGGNR